jgi:hypothetical protein
LDVPLVANQLNYTIPIRGVANGLRLLTLVDPNGNEVMLSMLRPENTANTYNWLSPYSTSTLYGFTMEDDHIVMFPKQFVVNPDRSLRFRFERQPSQLCATTSAAQIVSIAGNVVTVDNVPSAWAITNLVDLIKGGPAFVSKGDDLVVTNLNVGTSQITFAALPATAVKDDWIALAGTSPIPQIPYQMFPYLAQCVAIKALEGMADLEPYNVAVRQREQMKEDLLKLMQPRDMGNVQTIVNRGGLFDAGQFWGWGGGMGGW